LPGSEKVEEETNAMIGPSVMKRHSIVNKRTGYAIGAVLAAALAIGALAGCDTIPGVAVQAGSTGQSNASSSPAPTSDNSTGTNSSTGTITLPNPPVSPSSPSSSAAGTSPVISTGGGGSPVSPASPEVPQCHTAGLVVSVSVVSGSQGMGHESLNVTLTNVSGHSCTVYGFPGFQLENANHTDQPTAVTWVSGVPKTLVTLADGKSAATTVRIDDDVPAPSEPQTGACEPTSVYLQVTPPNETTQLVQKIGPMSTSGITVCEHGALDVFAFVPGSVGPNQ
jgi:hypothetical protein